MFGQAMMPSLADIAAVTGNNRNGNGDGFGDGNGWWVLIILFAIFGGWGNNGWGGNGNGGGQGALTRSDLCQDMNFSDMASGIRGISQGLCDGFYAMNTGMLNGFSGVQNAMNQGFAGINTALTSQGYETRLASTDLAQQIADCCCKTQNAIQANTTQGVMNTSAIQQQIQQCCCDDQMRDMQNKFAMQQYNCDTLQAIDRVGDRIIDYLNAQQAQTLRDENQALRLAASQQAQNNYLVSQLRPCPEPAYIVPNPYCCNTGYQYNTGCGNSTCC